MDKIFYSRTYRSRFFFPFKIIAAILLTVFCTGIFLAQNPTLEFAAGAGNPTNNGPSVASQVITFQNNTNNPSGNTFAAYSPTLSATIALSNQQYTVPTNLLSTGKGVSFGASGNSPAGIFQTLNAISGAPNTSFTSYYAGAAGTGIDVTVNKGSYIYTCTAPLNAISASTSGRFYYADLIVTFSSPVTNPVLHVVGLGGTYNTLGFATELELQTPGVTFNKLSGSVEYNIVSGTKILNSATTLAAKTGSGAASGSVYVLGVNISTLTFKLYLRGDGGGSTWSDGTAGIGDAWLLSFSKLTCNAGTTPPVLCATTATNTCPTTTADLTTITSSNTPSGTTLEWHTATPTTAANKVANAAAVGAGKYYAIFYDAVANCYTNGGSGTTPVVVSITAPCCNAGTASPTLSQSSVSNVCPATTASLSGITASNTPAASGVSLEWHTATPATSGNKVTTPGAVAAGTYYAVFYDTNNICYSNAGNGTTPVSVTITNCCQSGSASPSLSKTALSNTCPTTTADLTTITASNKPIPSNVSLEWHTATPTTSANKVSNAAAVAAGTYYGVFYDATNNCYSGSGTGTTAVTVSITSPCITPLVVLGPVGKTGATGASEIGNAATEQAPSGGTSPYTYTNGIADAACTGIAGATALPSANIGVTSGTGAYTIANPTTAGIYYYCIKICDNAATPQCKVVTDTLTVTSSAALSINTPISLSTTIGVPKSGSASTDLTPKGGIGAYTYKSVNCGSLSASGATGQGGTVSVTAGTGAYTYTPPAGYTGGDTFCIQVCDSSTPTPLCKTSTYLITIACPAGFAGPVGK